MAEITQIGTRLSDWYDVLFNDSALGIIFLDGKGNIQAINPFGLNLFGYRMDEIVNKPVEFLIPERFHHSHVKHRKKYYSHPKSRPMGLGMDLYGLRKDGTEFPVEVSLGKRNHEGNEHVIAFINDITIRKKSEDEIFKLKNKLEETVDIRTKALQETLAELELSKEQLEEAMVFQKALLYNAGAMIIATDDTGIITLFNPEAVSNLGYPETEVINQISPLSFHDKNEIAQKRKELYKEFGIQCENDFDVMVEKSRRNIHELEQYTYIRKDGSRFPVSLTITSIRDAKGQITGYMGISFDITERKKIEQDLKESIKREKEMGELKSRFVSMASHEFRTPLSTVLSSAYLIDKYTTEEDQPKREKHLQRIISSVNTLTDILNDFLSLGKMEEGKLQVKFSLINIKDFVIAINSEIKNTLKPNQKLQYHHRGSTMVCIDPSLLKHIIMNLVSNAGKFSPQGSPIEIKTSQYKNTLTLSVKDFGIGISKEDQKHLMERFFRGANAGNIQGTGLGLHIVSKYAEIMNGSIDYKSELEKGTEFIIKFKIKPGCNEKDSVN